MSHYNKAGFVTADEADSADPAPVWIEQRAREPHVCPICSGAMKREKGAAK